MQYLFYKGSLHIYTTVKALLVMRLHVTDEPGCTDSPPSHETSFTLKRCRSFMSCSLIWTARQSPEGKEQLANLEIIECNSEQAQ